MQKGEIQFIWKTKTICIRWRKKEDMDESGVQWNKEGLEEQGFIEQLGVGGGVGTGMKETGQLF